jgi:hypothetical protein
MQNHYHPSGKPETDQSEVGIYFAKGPIEKTVFSLPMIHRDLTIPAGDSNYKVTSTFVTPIDLEVVAISPHMHLLGRDMKVMATLPDGQVEIHHLDQRLGFQLAGPIPIPVANVAPRREQDRVASDLRQLLQKIPRILTAHRRLYIGAKTRLTRCLSHSFKLRLAVQRAASPS